MLRCATVKPWGGLSWDEARGAWGPTAGVWGLRSSGVQASLVRRGDTAQGLMEMLVQGHRAAAPQARCTGQADVLIVKLEEWSPHLG